MKLTKLYIHNYKSFYDTTIELDKMNIVVGENNSGKSNLIDVLEFIQTYLTKGSDKALLSKGGFERVLNYNYDENTIFIEWIVEHSRYSIKDRLTLNRNFWTYSSMTYFKLEGELLPLYAVSTRVNTKVNTNSRKHNTREYRFQDNMKKVSFWEKLIESRDALILLNSYIFATAYAFNTETIKNKSHQKSISELKKDGSNLGKNLFEIKKNHPNTFEIISNSMIGIVNEIDAIDVQETFGSYLIGFR